MSDLQAVQQLTEQLRTEIRDAAKVQARAGAEGVPLTVVCLPRHGYAATRATIERFYAGTATEAAFIYLDIMSPPSVQAYLREKAAATPDFSVVRVDQYISRQMARLLVLDVIRTPYTLFLDNNMLLSPGCVDELIRTAVDTKAAVVSPVIVMQGGSMHFSGACVEELEDGWYKRSQTTPRAPATKPIDECELFRDPIDFAESHCCLMRTDVFRENPAHWFPVAMHNAHTIAATCTLVKRQNPDARMLIEPRAVASILPIAFGGDLPWLFESYNDWEYYRQSYALHSRLIASPSSTIANLRWHRKHFLYLLETLLKGDRLEREDMLSAGEVPVSIPGYDHPLPPDIEDRLERELIPFVEQRYPGYVDRLFIWIRDIDDVIENIEYYATRNGRGRRDVPVPLENRTLRWDDENNPVLTDNVSGQGIRMNPEAFTVWSLCDGRNSEMDIEKSLVRQFPGNAREIVGGVGPLLRQLEAQEAIVMRSTPGAERVLEK